MKLEHVALTGTQKWGRLSLGRVWKGQRQAEETSEEAEVALPIASCVGHSWKLTLGHDEEGESTPGANKARPCCSCRVKWICSHCFSV